MEGIDWAARWRQMVWEREAQTDALQRGPVRPGSDFWERRAERFHRLTNQARQPDPFLERVLVEVRSDTVVLDVGAGTGRYALPLARRTARVIAVEPAVAMRRFLEADAAREGVRNLAVVPTTWEQAKVEPADLAICAHVLYPIAEAAPFLQKLDQAATRAVFLYLRVGQIDQPFYELWRRVHGQERRPQPSFVEGYNLLCQLGIYADVQIVEIEPFAVFDSLEEAVEDCRDRLALPDDAESAVLVRRHLEELLELRDGRLWLPAEPARAAIVRWTPRTQGASE